MTIEEYKELVNKMLILYETRAVLLSYKKEYIVKLSENYEVGYKNKDGADLQKLIVNLEETETAIIQLDKKVEDIEKKIKEPINNISTSCLKIKI